MYDNWLEEWQDTGKRFNKGVYLTGQAPTCKFWIDRGESCMSDGVCSCSEEGRITSGAASKFNYGYYIG